MTPDTQGCAFILAFLAGACLIGWALAKWDIRRMMHNASATRRPEDTRSNDASLHP